MSDELPAAVPVADTGTDTSGRRSTEQPARYAREFGLVLHDVLSGSAVLTILALFAALVIGGILIAVTDPTVQSTAAYFLARPGTAGHLELGVRRLHRGIPGRRLQLHRA